MKSETRTFTIPNITYTYYEIAEELGLKSIFDYCLDIDDIPGFIRHIKIVMMPEVARIIEEELKKMLVKIIMELAHIVEEVLKKILTKIQCSCAHEDIDKIEHEDMDLNGIDLDEIITYIKLLRRIRELERLLIYGRIRVAHSEKGNTQVITITLEYNRDPETTVVLIGDEDEVETIIAMLEEIKGRNTSKRRVHYYTGYSGFNRLYDLYRYLRP